MMRVERRACAERHVTPPRLSLLAVSLGSTCGLVIPQSSFVPKRPLEQYELFVRKMSSAASTSAASSVAIGDCDDLIGTSGVAQESIPCFFDCGFSGKKSDLQITSGNAKYPKFACKACHNAHRSVQYAAKTPAQKAALNRRKKSEVEAFKHDIRELAARRESSANDFRLAATKDYIADLVSFTKLQDEQLVYWLDKDAYIAHCRNVFGKTETEAKVQWDEAVGNHDIEKNKSATGATLLPFAMPLATRGVRGVSSSRGTRSVQTLEDEQAVLFVSWLVSVKIRCRW